MIDIPEELTINIIRNMCEYAQDDARNLHNLHASCHKIYRIMKIHRSTLLEHYIKTVLTSTENLQKIERFYAGHLHSFDQPAIECSNGIRVWYHFSQPHRNNDLPAVICSNGVCKWYRHGRLHRDNGYAIVFPAGAILSSNLYY